MSLYTISIRRPVLALVMSLVILLFGLISYTYLGVREYPNIDPPIITVNTTYVGANADIIESQITEPLEESINGIAGIKSLTSTSRDGRSSITVEFDLEIDLETAANDVRDRVARAMNNLPKDVDPPVVAKADADASPIVFLNLKSEQRDLLEMSNIASTVFKERLQTIPGVSQVQIWGERRYAMRIWIDPLKLAAYNLTPLDVSNALSVENIELPSGRIEGTNAELTIRTKGLLRSPTEFNDLIIKTSGTTVIRLKDIGRAELGAENERTILRRDGIAMVGVVLIPQPGSNHIAIADEFYRRIEQLKKEVPADIVMGIGFDTTKFIRESILEVEQSIIFSFILVIVIIYLFLRDWRSTFIPVLAVPISLIGSFFIMYIAGFSINVLTLLGLVLAIGLVVDDAIIVLENIYSKMEAGLDAVSAGIEGTKEIFFAVIATTVALVAVFLPIIFLQGLTGKLFQEFGVVLGGSVIISAFIALTLTPMLSSKLLAQKKAHSVFYNRTESFFRALIEYYRNSLIIFLNYRWVSIIILVVIGVAIYYFGSKLPSELAPIEDRSGLRLLLTGQEGTSYEFMDNFVFNLADFVRDEVPEAEAIISMTAPGHTGGSTNSGFLRLVLTDPDKRERTQQQIYQALASKVSRFNDVRIAIIQDQSLSTRGRGQPIQFVIQAMNLEKLKSVIPEFLKRASQNPVFQMADVNLKFNKPEIVVEVDRTRAKELGISISDITRTLQLLFSGGRYGYFILNGKQYQIIGQVSREDRLSPANLKSIYVRNNRGELIQLDNVVRLNESSNPPQLYRFNRYVAATISAGLAPGKTMGQGIEEMEKIADDLLDDTYSTALDGASKDFRESSSNLGFIFALSIVLIYLVLAAQFESFKSPLIIMFTVPLAIGGAVFSLWYFNQTLNIFSQIGQVMLIGLVTKNGILIVEFANQRIESGLSVMEAVKQAATARFRPILMTSLSTILGILPIALALGAGSESRVSMGIAVIGGMVVSTVLTLYVIPALFTYFIKDKKE